MDTTQTSTEEPAAPPASELIRGLLLSPLAGEGLVAQTVKRLGEAIGLGIFEVGGRLPSEAELAEQLGISAMTLREALAIMREAGYLETRRGRSGGTYIRELAPGVVEREALARVSSITDEYLDDLTCFRVAVGGESAALAATRATGSDLADLADLIERMASARSFEEFRKFDAAFHITIASCTKSHRLTRAETELQAELTPLTGAFRVGPQAWKTSNDQHRLILEAIEAGDAAEARRLMSNHMAATSEAISGFVKANVKPAKAAKPAKPARRRRS